MPNRMRETVTVMAAAIFVVFIPASTIAQNAADHKPKHKQYKLIDLGTVGGPNSIIFGATGPLNNSGMVTSCADKATADPFFPNNSPYFAGDPFVEDAFLWTGRALKDLGALPGGLGSCGQWISDNGEVVGASENGEFDAAAGFPSVMAVRWKHGSIQALGSFGGLESVAFAVNNAGQVTGGAANTIPDDNQGAIFSSGTTQIHTFLWEKGAMQDLGTLGGPDSQSFYINKRGEIAGLSTTNDTPNQTTGIPTVDPFVWKDGHMIDLGTLGGDNSFGNWINNAGQAVGTSDLPDGSHHAFVWNKGVIRDLGAVGSDNCSNGVGINSAGVATGTSTDCQGNVLHVFLWQDGSIVNLSALIQPGSDIAFNDPVMINDRGEIAGNGITSDGNNHAVLLIPVGDCDDECEDRAAVPSAGNSSLRGLGRIEEKTSPMNAARRRRHLR